LIACSQPGTNARKTSGTGDDSPHPTPYSRRINRVQRRGFDRISIGMRLPPSRQLAVCNFGATRCPRTTRSIARNRLPASQTYILPPPIKPPAQPVQLRQIPPPKRPFTRRKRHRTYAAQRPAILRSAPRRCGRLSHPKFPYCKARPGERNARHVDVCCS